MRAASGWTNLSAVALLMRNLDRHLTVRGRADCFVIGGLRRDTGQVHIILGRLPRSFHRSLKHRTHVHVESEIREGGCHDPGTVVVALLADSQHQHARSAIFLAREHLELAADGRLDGDQASIPPLRN